MRTSPLITIGMPVYNETWCLIACVSEPRKADPK